jgi:hypothetical protein
MGEGAQEWRARAQRRQHAQEEDHVVSRSQEDRRCSAGAVGEGQSRSEEIGLRGLDSEQGLRKWRSFWDSMSTARW